MMKKEHQNYIISIDEKFNIEIKGNMYQMSTYDLLEIVSHMVKSIEVKCRNTDRYFKLIKQKKEKFKKDWRTQV